MGRVRTQLTWGVFRVCVGRFLADNSVWIMAATMLATLDMGKKIGPDGLPIEPKVAMTNGGTW